MPNRGWRAASVLSVLSSLVVIVTLAGCGGGDGPEAIAGGDRTLLYGPRIYTGDPDRPWADGVVVDGGRVEALLDRREFGKVLAEGGAFQMLPGKVAVPGLVDAHAHLLGLGLRLKRVDLVGTRDLAETLERVSVHARALPGDAWVLGRGWDQNDWPETGWPDAESLERATEGRPALLRRIDGHAAWVNGAALTLAGIDRDTPDPPGGSILRDADGEPSGVLVDNAIGLVDRVVPPLGDSEVAAAVESAVDEAARLGLTGIHDMGMTASVWEALETLEAEGRLPLRVTGYAAADDPLRDALAETGPREGERLRLVGVKLYADGALGSRGARLEAPYDDAPGETGLWVTEPAELAEKIESALDAGLQPAVHAIGDAANRETLDILERLIAADAAVASLRPRVEHAQVLALDDLKRFAELGVVASMQPTHATSDMPWAGARLGEARLEGAYAWSSLLDTGALLAFGSDFPVESADPRLGLHAALTRQDASGRPEGGWTPDEKIDVGDALAAFSAGAAAAERRNDLGRIAPGFLCDMTLFDTDVTKGAPRKVLGAKAMGTVVAGELVPKKQGPDTENVTKR